jgi:hypothetical protein
MGATGNPYHRMKSLLDRKVTQGSEQTVAADRALRRR